MRIIKVYHADHGIGIDTLHWALGHVKEEGFFSLTLSLPETHPSLLCGLYGPCMGDQKITYAESYLLVRNPERGGINPPARMCSFPLRLSREVTIIGTLSSGVDATIYTSYAGPLAPRLPGDSSLLTEEEKEESGSFWNEHALSDCSGGQSYEDAEAEVKREAACYMSSLD